MKLEEFVKNHLSELLKYFRCEKRIVYFILDQQDNITDCNDILLQLLGLPEIPYGKKLVEFLYPGMENDLQFPPDGITKNVKLSFQVREGIPFSLIGDYIGIPDGVVFFGSRQIIMEEDIINQMTRLNNELSSLTRELNKKNIQLEEANQRSTFLMNTDLLTKLPNRRNFLSILHPIIFFSRRHKQPLSLAMGDLDHFKKINDSYGHEKGDYVLRNFARILKKSIRSEDIPCRFGGEEFILLLPNTDLNSGKICLDRIRTNLFKADLIPEYGPISISFGLTLYHSPESMRNFIKRADEALYKAKKSGRNKISVIE